jgi:hypothetical protein
VAGASGRSLSLQNTETIEYRTLAGSDIYRLENWQTAKTMTASVCWQMQRIDLVLLGSMQLGRQHRKHILKKQKW